jgi:SH3-like domain-containing protein
MKKQIILCFLKDFYTNYLLLQNLFTRFLIFLGTIGRNFKNKIILLSNFLTYLISSYLPEFIVKKLLEFFYKSIITKVLLILFLIRIEVIAFDKPVEKNYFVSLRSNETNARSGPGLSYPIKFTFKLRSLPIQVISEYDNWSEIKDYNGDTGWIDQNLLTKKREAMIRTAKSFVNFYSQPTEKSRILLRLENNVIGSFIRCEKNWCGIKVDGEKGWVKREELWGVDKNDIS